MPSHHGQFVWYELMTTDAAAAETFYRSVVGWGARDAGHPDMRYTLLLAGDTQVAGLMALPKEACTAGARPGWLGYIAVEDVDAYAEKIKAAGGKVHRAPDDIPSVGRFAMVADPHGAAFVLFKGTDGSSPTLPQINTPGHAGWRELMAGDGAAAFDFYSGLFGWTKGESIDMGPMGTYQLFAAGGDAIGGMMSKPPHVPAPFWTYYFQVDAIGAAIARLTAGGGTVTHGPMEVPGGAWIVQGLDPQGAIFALVSMTP